MIKKHKNRYISISDTPKFLTKMTHERVKNDYLQ